MNRTTQNKILSLRSALLRARSEADKFKNVKDDGTCNFDTPCIILPGWKDTDVREAFLLTGLHPYFQKDNVVYIFDASAGIGFRRTAMAEAVRDSLRESGYNAYVDYRID